MNFNRKNYSDETLINLYKGLLKPRMIEEKMLVLLRQSKISKWFSAYGQEAISVGVALAVEGEEWLFPSHRNLGVFTARAIPFERLFAQWQGKNTGFSKGRERSFHFGSSEYKIGAMISHMAAHLPVAEGVALGHLIKGESKISVAFCGDGATSEGDFHEALNLASVWNLPILFIVENNGYALSTPKSEQFKCDNIIDKAPGYGMDALQLDGNNVLEVYDTISQLAKSMRANPRPVLVEMLTFRMRGHEEASGNKYVPTDLLEKWSSKDPLENYEKYLVENFILEVAQIDAFKSEFEVEIDAAVEKVLAEPLPFADEIEEFNDIYASFEPNLNVPDLSETTEKRFIDAISEGLLQSMEKYENLVLMGQDIAGYGGVFKVTEGFLSRFGSDRVRNTPLCESAVLGSALGLSIKGFKSVVEMQFADFVTCGLNQIVNNLAKSHYRWGQNADVVVRMPTGAGTGGGPFHSQSLEAWFFHVPGLKIVYPSNAFDAKGLLCASIEDPNPVLFFEHKAMYRTVKNEVPDTYYTLEIGKAKIAKVGNDLTIITYGYGVIWALEVIEELKIDAEVVDLCTLLPWDKETVESSVRKTGKALVLNEDTITGSISAEIAAFIGEKLFSNLDAPVMRVGSLDTPVPFAATLEENFLAKARLKQKINDLVNF
ncbi:MAG: thiamine pyrophosphate-dependent enzyme [Cytophagales bacterium]